MAKTQFRSVFMLCWRRGRDVAFAKRDEDAVPLERFLAGLGQPDGPIRVPGTGVYLTKQHAVVPAALALNLRHNGVLHERVVLLKVSTCPTSAAEAFDFTLRSAALSMAQRWIARTRRA